MGTFLTLVFSRGTVNWKGVVIIGTAYGELLVKTGFGEIRKNRT